MNPESEEVNNSALTHKIWDRLKPIQLSDESRGEIVAGILEGAFPSRRFYILLGLSTMIAALGLLSNSTAVIIGAMIIAPLMGPILGLALGMVSANHNIERRSLVAEVTGISASIGIGFLFGLVPIHPEVGSEMLARTSPTVYDLAIAFASGLAGAYASVNRQINSALAGVAISVALVPPLATCGLFLAMGDYERSFGAFLLFSANFFCIQIAAAFVFWVFRLHREELISKSKRWQYNLKFAPGVLAVLAMGWFMTGTLVTLVQGQQFEAKFRKLLNEQISQRTGGRLDQILERQPEGKGYKVVASALTPKVLDSEQVRQIENSLKSSLNVDLSLIVRSLVSEDRDRSGRVFFNSNEKEEAIKSRDAAEELDTVRQVISNYLEGVPGAILSSLERSQSGDSIVLAASINAPSPIRRSQVAEIENKLATDLKQSIRLIVRSASVTVTDRNGDLFQANPEQDPVNPILIQQKERIWELLSLNMNKKPARRVVNVETLLEDGILRVNALVEATQPVRPQEVAKIQAELRLLDSAAVLTVRTDLSSEATAEDWSKP